MSFLGAGSTAVRDLFGNLPVAQRNTLQDPSSPFGTPGSPGLADVWRNLPIAQQQAVQSGFTTGDPFGQGTPPYGETITGPDVMGDGLTPFDAQMGRDAKITAFDIGSRHGGFGAQQTGFGQPLDGQMSSLGGDWGGVDQWNAQIQQAAAQTGVPANLIKAVMRLESGGDPNSVSVAGATGLMQIMPFWNGTNGLSIHDPAQNIMLGATILKQNYDQYGNWDTAIRAYLGFGQDAYGTTDQAYLQRVTQYWNELNSVGGGFGTGGGLASVAANPAFINGLTGGNQVGNSIVQQAMQYVGVPYVWGSIPGRGDNPWDTGWDCCIIGSMRIYGPGGVKRMDEVRAGDKVWSWVDGKIVPATVTNAWFSKRQPVYRVRTRGRSVVASTNHPFFVVRPDGEMAWVRLDELKRGDFLVTLNRVPTGEETVDDDEAWLYGLILGDGNLNGRHINLAVYGEVRERAAAILARLTENTPIKDAKHGITISARDFANKLFAMGLDARAHEKRVPTVVWTWNEQAQRAFLDGYCAADGHQPPNKTKGDRTYSSSSRDLIEEVRALHMSLGDNVGNISTHQRVKPVTIKGAVITRGRPIHSFAVWPQAKMAKTGGFSAASRAIQRRVAEGDGQWSVRPILGIEEMGEEDTFDIEVAGVGNFMADGVVVHNSGLTYFLDQRYGNGQLPMGSHYQYQYAQQTGQLFTNSAQLQPGDLVFINTGWQGGAGANLNAAGHVGMYIGNGQMLHAANPSTGTIVSPISGYGGILGFMHQGFSGGSAGVPGMTGQPAPQQQTGYGMSPQQRLIQMLRGG